MDYKNSKTFSIIISKNMNVGLNRLLRIHALVTLAAGLVLIISPGAIPATVSIHLSPDAYLLCYLLGAVEVSIAVLSYYGARLTDALARRLLCLTFVVLHSLTAGVELYAISQGASARLWGNIVLRVVVTALFSYYGFAGRRHTGRDGA